jgi:predicted nucleic acid-binding protein
LATTTINAFELASGARASKEQAKVEILLGALTILPLDARAAELAAGLRRVSCPSPCPSPPT